MPSRVVGYRRREKEEESLESARVGRGDLAVVDSPIDRAILSILEGLARGREITRKQGKVWN